jgi:HEAT repeat protein
VALASFEQAFPTPPSVPLRPLEYLTEQETAADALARIGPAAVPALLEALHSPDPEVRAKAANVLGRMGPDARDSVPELIRLLDDPDERVRKTVIRALGRIGPAAQDAVPGLMRTLLQSSPQPPTG